MKKLISFLLFFLITTNLFAKEVVIDVNGLVCEFCATTIEKSMMKEKEIVKSVQVDLQSKKVTITFFDNKNLTDERINEIIKNNGYNVEKISR